MSKSKLQNRAATRRSKDLRDPDGLKGSPRSRHALAVLVSLFLISLIFAVILPFTLL